MTIDVEGLKGRSDIVAIVSAYTPLKKIGVEYCGPCPIHGGDGDNFYVNPRKGIWACFSRGCHECEEGNDVVGFLRKIEGITFKQACEKLGADVDWKPVARVTQKAPPPPERVTSKPPTDAGVPRMRTTRLGEPSRTWCYRDADGDPIMYVARYDTDKGKEIRCWTWGSEGSAPKRWDCGQYSRGERPLYGLDKLAANPKAWVLIVEGEKAADAAQALLPAYVVVTWPAGALAWRLTNLQPLRGRSVLLWPDADQPGRECMDKLAEHLADPRTFACTVKVIDPEGMPEGFDAADWTGTTEELVAWAKPRASVYRHRAIEQPIYEEPPPLDIADLPPDPEAQHEPQAKAAEKPRTNGAAHESPVLWRRMSDIKPERTVWLWPNRIACGEISILTGNPGLGKSQISASLTSIVTNGGTWPVDRTEAKQGSVIILSAEDNTSKTIRPRLDAAGADVSRVVVLDAVRHLTPQGEEVLTGFSLAEDISKLGYLIHELGDVRLVIIDPISAYLGDIDSHNNAEVRGMLAPLQKLAEVHDVAMLCVTHQNKSTGMDALLKVQGSIAFGAAARAVWGVAKDKENPKRRYFMPMKNNLGEDSSGFAYSIESYFIESPNPDEEKIPTSRVMWEAEPVTKSTEEVFNASNLTYDESGALSDAKLFLRSLLADGPVESKQVEIDARGAGHSMATLRRAADELKVRRERDGFGRGARWKWAL